MPQNLSALSREEASLEDHNTFSDDASISSDSTHEDQSGKALLWRHKLGHKLSSVSVGKKKAYRNRILLVSGIVILLGLIVGLIWFSFVLTLIHRLGPHAQTNGLSHIAQSWKTPNDSVALLSPWPADFSRDLMPIPCHSHNDYWRQVPLYDALSAGCTSVEADIWLRNDSSGNANLLVGHITSSLKQDRTLETLYLDPLLRILENQNSILGTDQDGGTRSPAGLFETSPNTTMVLLLDFKSSGTDLWPVVYQKFNTLREKDWLTHWNASTNTIANRPITVVATGNAPYDMVSLNTTYRDIFFDAPLEDLLTGKYNSTNSYYASASISKALGRLWFNRFSSKQIDVMKDQIKAAADLGLVSRYWDTPSWPVSWRDTVWSTLVKNGVGMLNVDNLIEASRWDWDWCVIAGLVLCG